MKAIEKAPPFEQVNIELFSQNSRAETSQLRLLFELLLLLELKTVFKMVYVLLADL